MAKKKIETPNGGSSAAHLRKEVEGLKRQVKFYIETEGMVKEAAREVALAVKRAAPPKILVDHTAEHLKGKRPVTAVFLLGDWHIGEIIRLNEMEGFNAYNFEIATRRITVIVNKFLRWVKMSRKEFYIPEVVVVGLGDFISGDIHRELEVTNEFPVPVQTANAGWLLSEVILALAPHFASVRLVEVGADNHGRLTQKPQFKQKTLNNFSYLVYTIANARLEFLENFKYEMSTSIKYLAEINTKKFLIQHGDTVKSWMGIPFYGIQRDQMREAMARMLTDEGFHYQLMGHFHFPIFMASLVMNGSLSGTNEFDHAAGRLSEPAQLSFLVHQKYGVFNLCVWKPDKKNGASLPAPAKHTPYRHPKGKIAPKRGKI